MPKTPAEGRVPNKYVRTRAGMFQCNNVLHSMQREKIRMFERGESELETEAMDRYLAKTHKDTQQRSRTNEKGRTGPQGPNANEKGMTPVQEVSHSTQNPN